MSHRMTGHVVYRMYDENDRLLYIGRSDDVLRRIRQHCQEKTSGWVEDLAYAVLERFDDEDSAAIAEEVAIRAETPLWNVRHSPKAKHSPRRHIDRTSKLLTPDEIDAVFDRHEAMERAAVEVVQIAMLDAEFSMREIQMAWRSAYSSSRRSRI